ncbi:MAG TPA: Ig-like domain-containing protein, partial [Longimicrobium sp.]|nr:Ig-like domain-containing protein [Longimicrobium sp.]
MTFRQISGLLLLAAAVAACRDGSGPSRVGTVEADADSLVLRPGEGATLTARVLDGDGDPLDRSPVRWASSDTTVATVSGTGAVSAVRTGSAEITVESGSERDVVPVRVAFASTIAADSVNVHVNPFDAVLFTMPVGGEVVQLAASEADSGRIVVRRTPAGGGAEDLVWLGADGRPVAAALRTGARIGFTYNDPSGPVWVTRNGGSWLTLAGLAAAPPPGALPAAPAATASSVRLSTGLTVGNSGVSVPYPGATVAYQLRGPGALDWFYARAAETAGARYDAELPTGPVEG